MLKLGRNQITDAGILAIHEALPALLARLRLLDLSENRLTRYGTGMLEAAKGELPVSLDLSGNVQIGTSPGSVQGDEGEQERAQNEAHDAAEAAELRRRVAYPRMRPGDRTNPPG